MQQSLKENYSYKFIFWHGSVSRQVATQAILNADAHLLLIPNIDAHSDTIPAKSFEYMLTGRSIIVDAPAQAAVFEVLEGYPFVINIQEDDPMQALEVLQEAARLQSREMGKIYGREEQSQQLQAIIQGLIKENSDYPKHD